MFHDLNAMIPNRSRDNVRLRRGDHVCCPKCLKTMLICIKDPVVGDSNWTEWFKPVMFNNQRGAHPECPECQGRFYDPFKGVFTLEWGWTF